MCGETFYDLSSGGFAAVPNELLSELQSKAGITDNVPIVYASYERAKRTYDHYRAGASSVKHSTRTLCANNNHDTDCPGTRYGCKPWVKPVE